MWIVYSFLTAFIETGKDVLSKKSTKITNEYVSSFALQFFAALVLLPIVLFQGIPHIKPEYWLAMVFIAMGIPAWSLLYMKAVKISPLSVSIPMLAFNPIFTALFSIFFDKRWPSFYGWLGIILICLGLYFLRLKSETIKKGILYPILNIKNEPGALAMLGVAMIWSIGTHINKIVVDASSPLFFAFSATFVGAVILFVIAKLKGKFSVSTIRENFFQLGPIGVLNGFSELALGLALGVGYTPYVISIKRSSILWTSLAGKFLFKDTISKINFFGLALMFLGIIFIIAL